MGHKSKSENAQEASVNLAKAFDMLPEMKEKKAIIEMH